MADAKLVTFIEAGLLAGASRAELEQALVEAEWSREQIADD